MSTSRNSGDIMEVTRIEIPNQLNDILRQNLYEEMLTIHTKRTFKDTANELVDRLSRLLPVNGVGLYLYNDWEKSFELVGAHCKMDGEWFATSMDQEGWSSWIQSQPLSFCVEGTLCNSLFDKVRVIQMKNPDQSIYGFWILQNYDLDVEAASFIASETQKFLSWAQKFHQDRKDENRYELLFNVTSKFHSSMDMEDVLEEIVLSIKQTYPQFDCYLLLSHDYQSKRDLPIKELNYGQEGPNKASTQAYLTGNMQFEDRVMEKQSCLYAPLKGRQGVYGVLQVISPSSLIFPNEEVEFIALLAATAGNAIENARLYQQSKRLISDLQLVNETSHKLNSNLRLNETISYMTKQIIQSFQAEEVGFLLFNGRQKKLVALEGSTAYFFDEESQSFARHVSNLLLSRDDAILVGDFSSKYQEIECNYQSVMAIPMIQHGNLQGMVIVLHQKPYHFPFETFKLMQSLVHHSSLAFSNSMLREELERLVITDYLTELSSRSYLDDKIRIAIRHDRQGGLCLFDIDNFKQVNDTFGHQIGDEVLIQVADVLKYHKPKHGIAARWGGEELALYIPNADQEKTIDIAKKVIQDVSLLTNPKVTISCGVTSWTIQDGKSQDELLTRADKALYQAKNDGKNCVCSYTEK
ncbi:sensor domain-containing diguanylate cyclase [Bacillaceae bacterium S4-13-58]